MELPNGVSEADFLHAVEQVMNALVPQFLRSFGVTVDDDDLRQMGMLHALELMSKGTYDPSRSLESYIYVHVKRRLINNVRDRVHRSDPPCKRCHDGDTCKPGGCKRYREWARRQKSKGNLMMPERITDDEGAERQPWNNATTEDVVEMDVQGTELTHLIDEHLPIELRQDYLKMLAGVSLEIPRKRAVRRAILAIVDANNGRHRLPICRDEPDPILI